MRTGCPFCSRLSNSLSLVKGELMAREDRTWGFCVSALKQVLTSVTPHLTSNKRRRRSAIPTAAFKGLEALENRVMLTVTPALVNGVLTCTGTAGQANTISVALANNG